MVWEWSHSIDGKQNVRDNIANKPDEWLEVVFAEWSANGKENDEWQTAYEQALHDAKRLHRDILSDYIAEQTEKQALCDNGGFYAWGCPDGCQPHLVSFDRETE